MSLMTGGPRGSQSPNPSVSLTFSSCAASSDTWDKSRRFRSCWAGCGVSSTGVTTRPAWRSWARGAPRCCAAAASWRGSRRWWRARRPRGRSASGTRAGRRTAAPARPTPTRTRRAASPSFTTESSRITCRCGRAWRRPGGSSRPRPTPRSSPTWSTRRCWRARRRWSKGCDGPCARCTAPTRWW